ncbi:MAG TPA: hypothetical protein ENN21_11430 [Spirochaetes bacterium]|nr:hypothetical protein [Spirochaetota bacterium]
MIRLSKAAAAALLVLALTLGVLIGVGGDRWYVDSNFHAIARARFAKRLEGPGLARFFQPPPRKKERKDRLIKEKVVSELERQLDLNADQVRKIDAILEAQRSEVEKNRERFFAELRGVIERTYGEINNELDGKQKASFKKIIDGPLEPEKD